MARAEAQVNAGAYGEAIAALESMGAQPQPEAEARRLWALAMAHVRAGRPRAALPHLERLVSLAPANASVRLELAAALESAGQTERARYHYALARGANLSGDLAQEVDRRIDRIDRAKNWEGSFRFAYTPESNAARRTAAETVVIGDLPFRLKSASRAQPAKGVELAFGLAALPKLGEDLRLRFGASLDARLYDGGAPDDIQARAELGFLQFGDHRRRFGGGLILGQRWIDSKPYSSSRGLYLNWGRALDSRARTNLSFTLLREQIDYERRTASGTTRSVLAASLTHIASQRLQLSFGLQLERTDDVLASEAGDTGAITLGARYAFRGGLLADLTMTFSRQERDGPDSLLGITRSDHRQNIDLKLTHRDWAVGGFAPVLELGVEKQRSTNTLYSYDNQRILIGVTRRF
ncbi:surface lipoprotein assembly modifier [Salipiger pentaromativorans]|uniref:surface lipoprotein assembly modifier n=1 Tax=Salipiger pentaromativorans TaxID=2943193 RepID=UPI0021588D3A|nr:surface lipoprotein assembly modifier [Salipiger pentaromativorans]